MIQKFYFWVELKPGASNRYLYTNVHNSFIQRRRQPMCPLRNGWINKMYSVHTMEYYLTFKKE